MTFGFIRIYYPELADRVSFRLSFAALFCDIGYSGHLLINLVWDSTHGFLCGYVAWAIVFFALTSIFFIDCIALNLHIIFINEYKRRNFEKYYFIIAISIALLLSLLPAAADIGCWYRFSGQESNIIWEWITFFGWIDASILYCAIVIIMVVRKLKFVAKQTDVADFSLASQLSSHPSLINKTVILSVVRRVVWYPVVPVAQIFCSFFETCKYVNHTVPGPIMISCFIGMSLQVFSQDIAVTRAFQAVKLQWWITNVNSYESHYPHRSHNKAITDNFKWLRYMLLIKLFSPPKSSINSLGRNDSKQDISLDNQDDGQDINLILLKPVHLRDSFQISSDPLTDSSKNYQTNQTNINNTNVVENYEVDGDEGRINIININNKPTKRVSEEFEIMFKRL
ncbi:21608_t:CDS:2 [Cetraspora pellucida]|uniref:21608_t:CDS:1 n=1 Tax=Cetraspora pellucida TaxID=1433469 RepID=A0A9N9BI54_9GLOM|nr:21608_t:CDS:2 [Cetraspora pellucida]